MAALSQMQLQAMERVEVQEKELQRLSALLEEHQAVLRSSPERCHQELPTVSNLSQLRCEVIDHLSSTVNTIRGTASKRGHIPDLGKPPTVKRDTFEDILVDAEVPITLQRWVLFANTATSTPVLRPTEYLVERTPHLGASEVPSLSKGLFSHLELQKDLYEESFGSSLQVAATVFKKLQEPKVAKLKGGYSSDASLVLQSWLKDIWVHILECCLSQWEAIQLVKDYTSKHARLKVDPRE